MRIITLSLLAATCSTAFGAQSVPVAVSGHPKAEKIALTLSPSILDPTQEVLTNLTFSPSRLSLQDEKPNAITKEPKYTGKPKYGAFQIGNGPKSVTYFAIDDIEGPAGKIYVDTNQNGDLTDDGPGDWKTTTGGAGQPSDNAFVTVHASWGTPLKEVESGTYRLLVAHKPGGKEGSTGFAAVTGRVGEMKLAGKIYPVVLAANSNDGLFTVPADADLTRSPVSLYVATDSDKPITNPPSSGPAHVRRHTDRFDLAHPFKLADHWYVARPSISGSTLTVIETSDPGIMAAKPAEPMLATLPVGATAPNFTVQTPDGKSMSLFDFKGKVVVLDFWATWCGPCQAAMPALEKLSERIKGQDVAVLSINVLDEKNAFDAWMKLNAGKYNFNFGYDPAGTSRDDSIAISQYKVFAIPRVFVITRDGKIAATLTGSPDPIDLRQALEKQGLRTG